jgi:hypothetical protein
LLASKACDITGVVGIACARHGCFVPNALVDLFKGEQQKNVDFAFLKALTTIGIDPDQGVLMIYDIACQYHIHLKERIGHLVPPGLTIDQAIDLFHVHAHKDDCFFRFATTFIPGAAVVAGQIIESLWSTLNSISPTARTATLPHRAEILDDHTCDSNHKKMLAVTNDLRTRHMEATAMSSQTEMYYLDVGRTIDPATLATWDTEIKAAEATRHRDIRVMDLYAARLPDRLASEPSPVSAAASAAASASAVIDQWMEFALHVEESQSVIIIPNDTLTNVCDRIHLQDMVRRLGSNAQESDEQLVKQKRQALTLMLVKLKQLQHNAGVIALTSGAEPFVDNENEFDEVEEAASAGESAGTIQNPDMAGVEREVLTLPSNGNTTGQAVEVEINHRIKQARQQINRLRDIVADISFQYSHVIRGAIRKSVKTTVQKHVKSLHNNLVLHARIYTRCRHRLIALKCDEHWMRIFRPLRKSDLKASTAILRPNIPGSSTLQLSWIWQTGRWFLFANADAAAVADADADAAGLLECLYFPYGPVF